MGAINSSSSSKSSSNCDGKGGKWTYQIFFAAEADKLPKDRSKQKLHEISHLELEDTLKSLTDPEEEIICVTAYKIPLYKWQLTTLIMYHLFIVFETNNYWWSIEKNSEGITIQRSKKLDAVKSKYRQEVRASPMSLVKTDSGRKSVEGLIRWLDYEKELIKPYNYLTSNCKEFAERVFNHVARNYYL